MIQRRALPSWFGSSPIPLWNLVARMNVVTAATGERFADDLLGLALPVEVGGVDEVDPGVERGVDDPDRLVVIWVAPRAEHHRAETEFADRHAGVPQLAMLH